MQAESTATTAPAVAYYIDHRDPNAVSRALRLSPHLPDETVFLTSSAGLHDRLRRRALHAATIGVFDRAAASDDHSAQLLHDWMRINRPALTLCDAPFDFTDREADMPSLVRLRRPGHDSEDRLLRQYGNAERVLSPYADWLESEQVPKWLRSKTYYTGCLPDPGHRPDTRATARAACGFAPDKRYIVLLKAGSHGSFPLSKLASAARHVSQYEWVRIGPTEHSVGNLPKNLQQVGMVPDPNTYLRAADLVVSDADEAVLHRIAACGTPLVCLPDPDARHAQHTYAHALRRRGMALTFDQFPPAYEWPAVVRRAARLSDTKWNDFYSADSGNRVQEFLQQFQHQTRGVSPAANFS